MMGKVQFLFKAWRAYNGDPEAAIEVVQTLKAVTIDRVLSAKEK